MIFTYTLHTGFVTKRFSQRLQKMLAAQGLESAFAVQTNFYGSPIGQYFGVNVSNVKDLDLLRAVCEEYKNKYNLNNESYFNMMALRDALELTTWHRAKAIAGCWDLKLSNLITPDGQLKPFWIE